MAMDSVTNDTMILLIVTLGRLTRIGARGESALTARLLIIPDVLASYEWRLKRAGLVVIAANRRSRVRDGFVLHRVF